MMESKYELGLYEKGFPKEIPFERMLEETQKFGFDTLEISIDESDERQSRLNWSLDKRLELYRSIMTSGTPIRTMCLSGHRKYPLGSHNPEIRKKSLEIMNKAIALSNDLGIRIIQLAGYDVYYENGDEDTRKWFGENLQKSVEVASRAGVLLGFETMETPFMDTCAKAMEWVNALQSPYLGVYPDIGNMKNSSVLYGHDVISDLLTGKGHIVAAHLKETVPGIFREVPFGTGHTEFVSCCRELLKMGVFHFTGEFWYVGEPSYQDTMIHASTFLRENIKKALE